MTYLPVLDNIPEDQRFQFMLLFSANFKCTVSRISYWSYFGHGGEEEDTMLLSGIKLPPASSQFVTFLTAIMAQNCAPYYTFMRISIMCISSSSLQYQKSLTKN